MSKLKLFTAEITDEHVRKNFEKLQDADRVDPFGKGNFKFLEYVVVTGGTFPKTITIPHGLRFQPIDVIQLSTRPYTVTINWHYDAFTRTSLVFDVSAACTIRAYVGRYGES